MEEGDLKQYLETLLTGCLRSETNAIIQLSFACRLGSYDNQKEIEIGMFS